MKLKMRSCPPVVGVILLSGLLGLYGCDDYSDHFSITPPNPLRVTVNYPGLASFDFRQSAKTSSGIPSEHSQWEVSLKKLTVEPTDKFVFLVNVYDKAPFILENLGWTKTVVVNSFADSKIDLGMMEAVLREDLLEVIILDNGITDDNTDELGGNYEGDYTLLKDGAIVRRGRLSGFVDYSGQCNLELVGVEEFQFIKGHGVRDGSTLNLFSDLTDSTGRPVTPFNSDLAITSDGLNGSATLISPDYDELEINIKKKAL